MKKNRPGSLLKVISKKKNREINQINDNLDNIYIDKLNKTITEDQFNRVKNKLEIELDRKITRLNELKKISSEKTNEEKANKEIEKFINKFLTMNNPSRELVSSLIDRIDIFEDKRIVIKVSFSDNY